MYPLPLVARSTGNTSEAAAEQAAAERKAIEAVLAGDRAAFRILVERHQRGVHNVIQRLVHSAADADELAQQAFLSAFDALGRFDLEARFSSWIYRIAINLAKDHLKSPRRGERPANDAALEIDPRGEALFAGSVPATDEPAMSAERQRLLQRGLAALSLADREVLVLRDLEELPYEEMRSILRRPITALKIRVLRARARLRGHLERLAGKEAL